MFELPDSNSVPHYQTAVICFALSCIIEMAAEPLWVIGQSFLFVRLKVVIEGSAIATKCILTVLLVFYWPQLGLYNFSIAQLAYTFVYLVLYYAYFLYYVSATAPSERARDFPFNNLLEMLPHKKENQAWFGMGTVKLTWSFFKQSILKQFLTEGEKYAMTIFSILSFGDQGVYDVINNLGSLAARFLFLPIEESCYLFFSQTLTRGVPVSKQNKDSINLASQVLEHLLKVVTYIGLTIFTFGYAYSYLLLHIYGGVILSSGTGPVLLKWYCLYVLVIAINGTSEGFVFAAMSQKDVDGYNQKMLLFSVLFLLASYYLAKMLGAVGFILANCLNMIARIIHSIYYVSHYMKEMPRSPLIGLLPSLPVSLVYFAAFVITTLSEKMFCCDKGLSGQVIHIGIGGICLMLVLITICLKEQKLISFIMEHYSKSKQSKKKN
ncbi:man(5)GlcNAc(2)-PP-dolichol translocation protein RFT1-like isoform X2 [Tubulanus polymorphus]